MMRYLALSFFLIFLCSLVPTARAQSLAIGTANSAVIQGKPTDGAIISYVNNQYILSKLGNDPKIVGVVSLNPSLNYNLKGATNQTPILSEGVAVVQVSTLNGNIKSGDIVTSSTKPGVGMKATNAGYVLGMALEDYSGGSNSVGRIRVNIDIHYHTPNNSLLGKVLDLANIPGLATYQDSAQFLKYGLAGFVIVFSFLISFILFGRASLAQINAMGRNPLAANAIRMSFIVNLLLIVLIGLGGVVLGFFIIKI